ncbi:MAG: universal stress protein [Panacagrimonas sp.]
MAREQALRLNALAGSPWPTCAARPTPPSNAWITHGLTTATAGGRVAKPRQHRILIATDGSRAAQAALATAARFPWPELSSVRAVIARTSWLPVDADWLTDHADARAALEKNFEPVAAAARSVLARRWPDPKVVIVDEMPQAAILAEATRFRASLIVLGWRGHGRFRRLLAGSVSRSIAAHAPCPVLVVRDAPKTVRRFVLGFDGYANAGRALDFLGSLHPVRGSSVVLVNVVEPVHVPTSLARFPSSIRAPIRREVTAIKLQRREQGQARLDTAAARLERSGWAVRTEVRVGDPLACLLEAVEEHRADVLILGARATDGLEPALLGSVANGALDRSPVAVLLVR